VRDFASQDRPCQAAVTQAADPSTAFRHKAMTVCFGSIDHVLSNADT